VGSLGAVPLPTAKPPLRSLGDHCPLLPAVHEVQAFRLPRRTLPRLGQLNRLGLGHAVLAGTLQQPVPDPGMTEPAETTCQAAPQG
jgi:hypothetical protein